MEQLEERKTETSNKIALEKSKTRLLLTKSDIVKYLKTAIKKERKPLLDLLLRQAIQYNDKIEIYYNYTSNKSPDEFERQGFCFYTITKSFEIDQHKLGVAPVIYNLAIELFI
ncbi:hypothetical protein EOM82_06525 [bacterium]|nr:hypothetical protein [bacterium]